MISGLNAELLRIKAVHEMTRKKTKDLMTQISTYENRYEHVNRAWLEAEKIAQDITDMAQSRVDKIVDNAHRTVGPLHEQITVIDKEINILVQELAPPPPNVEEGPDMLQVATDPIAVEEDFVSDTAEEMILVAPEYSLQEPQLAETEEMTTNDPSPVMTDYADIPLPKREYSLREPQAADWEEIIITAQPGQIAAYEDLPLPQRGYSLRESQTEKDEVYSETTGDESYLEDMLATAEKREYSLREPQQGDLEMDNIAVETAEIEIPYAQQEHHGYSMGVSEGYEAEVQEIDLEVLGADETEMRFDIFLDSRHYEVIDGVKTPIHSHNWQVRVDVEVAEKTPEAPGYSKISSIVDCTLLRYDSVLLNDAYPFTIIEPSCANMAMYFFNFLDDNLVLMGIAVKALTLWENPDDAITITTRNIEIDAVLKRGEEDIFGSLRDKVNQYNSSAVNTGTGIRGRLGSILRGR